jgi:hypothetical protein
MKKSILNLLTLGLLYSGFLSAQAPNLTFTFPNTTNGDAGQVAMSTNDTILVKVKMTGFNGSADFVFHTHNMLSFPGMNSNESYCEVQSAFELENNGFTLQANVEKEIKVIFTPIAFNYLKNEGEEMVCTFFSPGKGCTQWETQPKCVEYLSNGIGFYSDQLTFYTNATGTATFNNFTVSGTGIDMLGVLDEKRKESFQLYPNPAKDGKLHFSIEGDWKISNLSGQQELNGEGEHADISSLKEGFYIVHISNESGVFSNTFVKQ